MKFFHRCNRPSDEIRAKVTIPHCDKGGGKRKRPKWYRRINIFRRTKRDSELHKRCNRSNFNNNYESNQKSSYDWKPIKVYSKESNKASLCKESQTTLPNQTSTPSASSSCQTSDEWSHEHDENTDEKISVPSVSKETLLEIDSTNTYLHCACFLHDPAEEILKALEENPNLSKISNSNGELPLHYACLDSLGAEDRVVNALLASYPQGAMCENADRSLPLHLACMIGSPSIYLVQSLLYANPSAALLQSEFAMNSKYINDRAEDFHHCIGAGTGHQNGLLKAKPMCVTAENLIEILNNGRATLNLFYSFRAYQCTSKCNGSTERFPPSYGQIRIDQSCSPQPPQSPGLEQGWSALHLAALSGASIKVLNILLEYGPEMILAKTSQGRTPVDCAANAIKHKIVGAQKAYELLSKFRDKYVNSHT